jgi:hypothetical protein
VSLLLFFILRVQNYCFFCVCANIFVLLQPNAQEYLHIYRFIPAIAGVGIIGYMRRFRLDLASSPCRHRQ